MKKQEKYKMVSEDDKNYIREQLEDLKSSQEVKKSLKDLITEKIKKVDTLKDNISVVNFQDELEDLKEEFSDSFSKNLIDNLIKDIESSL